MRVAWPRRTRAVLTALTLWAFGYACYRGYYAFGGSDGMIGRPVSMAQFRRVNAVGVLILLVVAVIPLVTLRRGAPQHARSHRLLLGLCWMAAAGSCMHALVDGTLRILSLTGVHALSYPPGVWVTVYRRTADLQDLLFNEPWFLVEGCLWALVALLTVKTARSRRLWLSSAAAACAVATVVGLLTGLGVIRSVRLG